MTSSSAGVAQPFNIADAVQEVSVQTGNFGAEFGRAAGGIINVVTKSGTNSLHGTLLSRYQSQRFNSVSNVDKINGTPESVFSRNVYGFTVGGPLRKNKTFFFGGFQQDTLRSTLNVPLVVPTEAAVATLRSLFPSNPRLDLYLGFLGSLRGSASPIGLQLGEDPQTGIDRGVVQFASAPLSIPASNGGPQWLVRVDHEGSEAHQLAFRYIYDSRTDSPNNIYFPGFVLDQSARNQNFLFTDHYIFSPAWTNEFRFSYARQEAEPRRISPQSVPAAMMLPQITIPSIDSPGVPSVLLHFRKTNNLLFQETQTKLSGRHTFRYGVEFLRQLATQSPAAWWQGQLIYTNAVGYSGFANFLDDFSGPSGRARKDFGATVFHPNQFRQTYFFQDAWLPAPSLSLTLGLRYENFGQPANSLRYPAFAGFDPDNFLKPNRVNTDNNNFGPSFGLAWSPSFRSGWLGKLFGEDRTVWRGGYQISYDAFFTQMISLLLATSTPNAISADIRDTQRTARGTGNWFAQLPRAPSAPSLLDAQLGALEKNLRSPYTERWSFGFQRQLSTKLLLDGSYVGSVSHKLTTWANVNPLQPDGQRLHPDFGPRDIRTSQGNSSYHSMQWRVDRRFARGFQATASYTWSRNLDSTSEGVGAINNQSSGANRTSVPPAEGGLKLDRGPSDYDRTHRLSVLYVWDVPGPAGGFWKNVLGGWSIAGISSFQSGAPFTVENGITRAASNSARPDLSNPNSPLNSRAILTPASGSRSCVTGYRNPDTDLCVNPADVHWIQGVGLPNASTVGRNTLLAGGINNFDLSLTKSFRIREQRQLMFRLEAFNAFNHPQFTQVPEKSVVGSPGPEAGLPSRFLNRDFTDSGIRSMWVQLKLVF